MTKPLPDLLPCPVCGRAPTVIEPLWPGMWARVECCQSAETCYHTVVAMGRTDKVAAERWNKMVKK
jgi:hypothetical protein